MTWSILTCPQSILQLLPQCFQKKLGYVCLSHIPVPVCGMSIPWSSSALASQGDREGLTNLLYRISAIPFPWEEVMTVRGSGAPIPNLQSWLRLPAVELGLIGCTGAGGCGSFPKSPVPRHKGLLSSAVIYSGKEGAWPGDGFHSSLGCNRN